MDDDSIEEEDASDNDSSVEGSASSEDKNAKRTPIDQVRAPMRRK